jgi:hypothetical protein
VTACRVGRRIAVGEREGGQLAGPGLRPSCPAGQHVRPGRATGNRVWRVLCLARHAGMMASPAAAGEAGLDTEVQGDTERMNKVSLGASLARRFLEGGHGRRLQSSSKPYTCCVPVTTRHQAGLHGPRRRTDLTLGSSTPFRPGHRRSCEGMGVIVESGDDDYAHVGALAETGDERDDSRLLAPKAKACPYTRTRAWTEVER